MSAATEEDEIAAAYVLGMLPADQRLAVDRQRAGNPRLASDIAWWEQRLAPLNHRVPDVVPPSDMLERILGDLAGANVGSNGSAGAATQANVQPLHRAAVPARPSRAWWAAAAASLVLSFGLGAVLSDHMMARQALVAVLEPAPLNPAADEANRPSGPMFLVRVAEDRRSLTVRQLAGPRLVAGRAYALWLQPDDGAPVPLARIRSGQPSTKIDVPALGTARLERAMLIVTLESGEGASGPTMPAQSLGRLLP